jgi:hypothetical protein
VRSRVVAVAFALLPMAPGVALAQGIEDLASRVEVALEVARAGVSDPGPERMEEVRAAVALPDEVEVAGRRVEVAADPLLARLDGDTAADFESAVRRLEALRDAIADTAEAASASESELRGDLRGAYQGLGSAEPGLLERVRRAVESFLSTVVRRGVGALRGGPAWAALAVALALVLVAVWRLRVRPVPLAATRDRRGTATAVEWRRRADEAAGRGDLAGSVVARYRSLVAGLAERGLVDDRPSLTAGEIRVAVAEAAPRLAEPLRDATRRYERVRYGMVPATDDDLRALVAAERRARAP